MAASSPTSIQRQNFKFPSLAAAACGLPIHLQVFSLQNPDGTIAAYIWGDNGWVSLGAIGPIITPKANSPLAAVSWVESKVDQVSTILHLYSNSSWLTSAS